MTERLQQALAEIEKLPADTQDAVAARILADLADDRAWARSSEATSAEQWNRLAALAHEEIVAGDTVPLEEVFPPKASEKTEPTSCGHPGTSSASLRAVALGSLSS
jgi:hypothetical protein